MKNYDCPVCKTMANEWDAEGCKCWYCPTCQVTNHPNSTTCECKPQRTSTGDYIYRGHQILRGEIKQSFIVGLRGNNGHTRYRRFKTLKAACAYIDGIFVWHCA